MTEPVPSSTVPDAPAGPDPVEPAAKRTGRRGGVEMSSARAALVALVAGAALAVGAARTVELLVVIAVIQVAFVVAWVLGAAVAVEPGESFDGPAGVVGLGPAPALLGGRAESGRGSGAEGTVEVVGSVLGADAAGSPNPLEVAAPVREEGPSTDAADGAVDTPAAVVGSDDTDPTDDTEDSAGFGANPSAGAMPGRVGALLIGLGTAAVADFAVSRWPHSELSPMLGILGLAVPVMFVHQLVRGVVRARVVESLSGVAMIIVAVIALPALLQLRHEVGGGHLVAAAALASAGAVVVGLLVDLVWSRPRFDPEVPRGLSAVVVATVAGGAVAAYPLRDQAQFSTTQAVLYCAGIAAVSALVAVATSLIAHSSPASTSVAGGARLLRPVALALLPIMLVAPAAYELLVRV